MPLQIAQQATLDRTLETLPIDICCLSETRLQHLSFVRTLRPPTCDTCSTFTLRLSGDDAASNAGQTGVGIVLSPWTEDALIDWIPVDSRMCAVRLAGLFQVSKSRVDKWCLFVITAYAPTNCSSDSVKDDFTITNLTISFFTEEARILWCLLLISTHKSYNCPLKCFIWAANGV
ncbi:unnamed protein product [Dicrocoelium dendriticum]|nr:unnamed protein product [Dicrocoelium dendriticum]